MEFELPAIARSILPFAVAGLLASILSYVVIQIWILYRDGPELVEKIDQRLFRMNELFAKQLADAENAVLQASDVKMQLERIPPTPAIRGEYEKLTQQLIRHIDRLIEDARESKRLQSQFFGMAFVARFVGTREQSVRISGIWKEALRRMTRIEQIRRELGMSKKLLEKMIRGNT